MNTTEALVQAARPELANSVAAAGGALPNIASLAQSAIDKNQEEILKALSAEAVGVLQGATSKIAGLVNEKVALDKALAKNAENTAAVKLAQDYFKATNNMFPLRKLIGIPTPKDVLTRYPKIDEVPEGWTAPVAPAAASAQ